MRDPSILESTVIKPDTFLLLKGYTFRFRKEAADYVSEPDFVPFIWRRSEKDDDGKGLWDNEVSECLWCEILLGPPMLTLRCLKPMVRRVRVLQMTSFLGTQVFSHAMLLHLSTPIRKLPEVKKLWLSYASL